MSPWLDALWAIAKVLGMVLGVMAVGVLGLVVFLDIWAKKATVGKFYCFFLEQKYLFGRLLKSEGSHVYLGKGEDREEYLLDPVKQFWAWWPQGIPQSMQVPVRAHLYVRYNPEPFDPTNLEALISAKSLRIISDEAMLKMTWKDVRDSARVGAGMAAGMPSWALILLIASASLSGFTLYIVLGLQKSLAALANLFGG